MKITEPPWHLTGTALVVGFPARPNRKQRDVSASASGSTQSPGRAIGGAGAVVLADYRTSDVGPYRELLIAPGRFRSGTDTGHTITRIFVDSEASAVSGRANWGIPKETALLSAGFAADGSWRFSAASADGNEGGSGDAFFSLTARPFGPSFPVPFGRLPFRLLQEEGGLRFLTRLGGSARGRFARIERVWSDPSVFPFPDRKPRIVLLLETFALVFPPAELLDP
ncbi:acetoacetate decarboxylase family protein [Saccharibacillus alkalitolerans]|uniref:Acetoacetate decarboxylase family protein n=1 Tax=Saccharibacillus alkalitolerans TaxID=2705290 RepID=A0ABX0FAP4_9BACL|nr:acetoacetate decarboxylase family protein [Saccharibacillus alkalitolerans]NGZ77034.1 acetoacetate decarboxylase family protein [Saccharibacillus alkalitolerans]